MKHLRLTWRACALFDPEQMLEQHRQNPLSHDTVREYFSNMRGRKAHSSQWFTPTDITGMIEELNDYATEARVSFNYPLPATGGEDNEGQTLSAHIRSPSRKVLIPCKLMSCETDTVFNVCNFAEMKSDYLLAWWESKKETLPFWYKSLAPILAFQPSSAASERVFSLLKLLFGPNQSHSGEDYIETACMRSFNKSGVIK
jgi:hypothetical protein